jgi:hypothetical protein
MSAVAPARHRIDGDGDDTAAGKEPGRRTVVADAAVLVQGEQGVWQESI